MGKLARIARVGLLVDVGPGGSFDQELKYGNDSFTREVSSEIMEKAIGSVVRRRANMCIRWHR